MGYGSTPSNVSSARINNPQSTGSWFFSWEMVDPYGGSNYYYDDHSFAVGIALSAVVTTSFAGNLTSAAAYPYSLVGYAHLFGISRKIVSNVYGNTNEPGNFGIPHAISYNATTGVIQFWAYEGTWNLRDTLATITAGTEMVPFAMIEGEVDLTSAGKFRIRSDLGAPNGFSVWA